MLIINCCKRLGMVMVFSTIILAAGRFAAGLGLEFTGSIGMVVRVVKVRLISRDEGLEALEKLTLVMWLNVGVYEDVRKVVEGLGLGTRFCLHPLILL